MNQPVVVDDPMEVDDNIINNVVDVATAGVLEEIHTPAKRRHVPIVFPPLGPLAR